MARIMARCDINRVIKRRTIVAAMTWCLAAVFTIILLRDAAGMMLR
jgi:hypothetical protein